MDEEEVKPIEEQVNDALPLGDMMLDFNSIAKPMTVILQIMVYIRKTLKDAGFREEYIEQVCSMFYLQSNGKL